MIVEHQVWSVPPGLKQQIKNACFEPERWQWAEKLAQFLRDQGSERVEVRDITTPDSTDEDCHIE